MQLAKLPDADWPEAAEAMAAMRRVQAAVEGKQLSPDHPQIVQHGAGVYRSLMAKDAEGVRRGCGLMLDAIANLPSGHFRW